MKTLFYIFWKLKNLGWLYVFLAIYSYFSNYIIIAIYHLRAGQEWISFFIPLAVFNTIISLLIGFSIYKLIKKM